MHVVRWLIALAGGAEFREVSHETLPARCLHPGDLPRVGDFVNFGKWKYRVSHRHWTWESTLDGLACTLTMVIEVVKERKDGKL